MKVHGLQKLTLLDFPGKVTCTIFTGGCNFRCPFCHNALLVTDVDPHTAMDESEVLSFLEKRVGLLDGVCFTGGEPLLQKDIRRFMEKVKAMGYAVKLDTNGSFPGELCELIDCHLVDYVAMDIKNSKEKYFKTVGLARFDLSTVEESVRILLEGKVDYEFRTTVVQEFHTVEDIEKIADWIKGAPRYFLQNFEDSGNLIGENLHAVSRETLQNMQKTAAQAGLRVEIRGI